jgi:integral membrane protein (TIGR00529 family)
MDLITALLPFIKVLAAFALMLAGMRNKIGLALSIFCGGAFMGLVFGLDITSLSVTAALALTQEKFLFLTTIVGLIMILSDGLERSGQSQRLMRAVSKYLASPRLRLIFFPALIGLLPMPGGAIFSAPMVKTVGDELKLKNQDQAVINYWFRHVWEMAWPLYPGIILTVALAGIPISALISKTWPGVVAMYIFGYYFFLRKGILGEINTKILEQTGERKISEVLREGLPLLIAIIGAIGLETLFAKFSPAIPFEWGVILALILAVACIIWQNGLGLPFAKQVLAKKSLWAMLLVIAAIFIFKDIMQAAAIVDEMAGAAGGGVALFAAAVFLPFLVGMVAGINVAFVGATFPLLLGLLDNMGMESQIIPYLVIASFSGFTGVMISPIHICFVLTCNFFGANVARAWRRLVPPCICFGLSGGVLFYLLTNT